MTAACRYGSRVARPTPTAVRRQLGSELRRLRGRRRGADVAAGLGWSESKLSRIETARTGISATDLERLLAAYDVAEDERTRLLGLAQQAPARGWWHSYRAVVPDPLERYVGYESECAAMFEWEPQIVPGLLQTDEYARAVIEIARNLAGPDVVEHLVALRMARQAVLTRHPEPRLWAILDEGVLRRQVGGREVMRRQVQRLYDASHRPGITLQILPFAAGIHLAVTGAFTIFEFGPDGQPPVIHSEGITGGTFRDRPSEVQLCREVFTDAGRRALDADETRKLLASIGAELQDS